MDNTEKKVRSIIAETLGVNAENLAPGASFRGDLDADSLDAVELAMALEEAFDIDIPDEEAAQLETVRDAVDYVRFAIEAAGRPHAANATRTAPLASPRE